MATTPVDWTITIDVKNGDLDYGGDENRKVFKKDRVRWTSPYDFAVIFNGGKSPFTPNAPYQASTAGTYTAYKKIKKPKVKNQKFKYVTAVLYNGTILLEDPVIIVDDDGGGGGGTKAGKSAKKKKAPKK